MSESNGTHPENLSLEWIREETRRARALARMRQAQAEADLWESSQIGMGWGPGWGDLLDPFSTRRNDFSQMWLPNGAGQLYGRQDGRNRPFVWTDIDLDRIRSLARWLATRNPFAIGILSTIRNYLIKRGYTWEVHPASGMENDPRAVALARQCQKVIDEFSDINSLQSRERSSCWRAVRDGEVFVRLFAQEDGRTLVRFIEPEQVREQSTGNDPDCAFGIETEPGDVERPLAYYVTYDGTEFDRVPAAEVCHLKRNVDECVKRGLSDFYATQDALDGVYKLLRNMREAGAVQAAIAWIEQFESTTASQAASHIGAVKDLNRPNVQNPIAGRNIDYQRFEPGTIVKVGKGKEYLPAPLAGNTTNHVSIAQACLRALGVRWGIPEHMISGDASNNNYASILVTGSPFVNAIECDQDDFGRFFLRWRWIAIRIACERGRLPGYTFADIQTLVDVKYTAPQVAVSNESEQAAIDHQDLAAGVMSIQTRCARRGLDYDQEQRNLAQKPPTRVQGKFTDLDSQGNPVTPGSEEGGDPGQGQEFGEEAFPTIWDLEEAQKREKGEVWKGPSGRYFTVNQAGRVVPAKNPNAGEKKPVSKKKDEVKDKEGSKKNEKPKKADPVEIRTRIEQMRKEGKTSAADVKSLAESMMGLTVAQITALKKELELKASGNKVELAKKVAEKALAAAGVKSKKKSDPEPKRKEPEKQIEKPEVEKQPEPKALKTPRPPQAGYTGTDTLGRKWKEGQLTGEWESLPAEPEPKIKITPGRKLDVGNAIDLSQAQKDDLIAARLYNPANQYVWFNPNEYVNDRSLRERLQRQGLIEPTTRGWNDGSQRLTDKAALALGKIDLGDGSDPVTVKQIKGVANLYTRSSDAVRAKILAHYGIKPDDPENYDGDLLRRDLFEAARRYHNPKSIGQRIRDNRDLHDSVTELGHIQVAGEQEIADQRRQLDDDLRNHGLNSYTIDSSISEREMKLNRGAKDKKKLREELAVLRDAREKLIVINAKRKEFVQTGEQKKQDAVSEHLRSRIKGRVHNIHVGIAADLEPHAREAIERGTALVKGILGRLDGEEAINDMSTYRDGTNGRAHYRFLDRKINAQGRFDAPVAVHEIMHGIEIDNPGIHEAIQEFRRKRIGNEAGTKLSEKFPGHGFEDSEVGYKDRFDSGMHGESSAYYAGKIYNSTSTEILTMGVESLLRDPVKFATGDPEYCAFIVGILDGSLRNKPVPLE